MEESNKAIIEEFSSYLKADGKTFKTVISYTGDVLGFLKWLAGKGTKFTGELQRFYITSYKNYLEIKSDRYF